MNAKERFETFEAMSREHARSSAEDRQFWLNEAEEWARFAEATDLAIESPPLQADLFHQDMTY